MYHNHQSPNEPTQTLPPAERRSVTRPRPGKVRRSSIRTLTPRRPSQTRLPRQRLRTGTVVSIRGIVTVHLGRLVLVLLVSCAGETCSACADACERCRWASQRWSPSEIRVSFVLCVGFLMMMMMMRIRRRRDSSSREIMTRHPAQRGAALHSCHIILLRVNVVVVYFIVVELVDELTTLPVGRGGGVSRVATLGLFVECVRGSRREIEGLHSTLYRTRTN